MQGLFKNPLVLALLASVLLNGVLLGKGLSDKQAPDRAAVDRPDMRLRGGQARLENLPRHLSPKQRLKFDMAAKSAGSGNVRESLKDLRLARKTVMDLAQAEPLDPDALRAAMEDARTKAGRLSELTDEVIAAWLADANAQERQDAIKAMRRPGRGKGKRGGGPKGERGERR